MARLDHGPRLARPGIRILEQGHAERVGQESELGQLAAQRPRVQLMQGEHPERAAVWLDRERVQGGAPHGGLGGLAEHRPAPVVRPAREGADRAARAVGVRARSLAQDILQVLQPARGLAGDAQRDPLGPARVTVSRGCSSSTCSSRQAARTAGVVRGRTLTSYPSIRTDIRNAGGNTVDEEVAASGM